MNAENERRSLTMSASTSRKYYKMVSAKTSETAVFLDECEREHTVFSTSALMLWVYTKLPIESKNLKQIELSLELLRRRLLRLEMKFILKICNFFKIPNKIPIKLPLNLSKNITIAILDKCLLSECNSLRPLSPKFQQNIAFAMKLSPNIFMQKLIENIINSVLHCLVKTWI